jgi:hypothetical protein
MLLKTVFALALLSLAAQAVPPPTEDGRSGSFGCFFRSNIGLPVA